MPGRAGRAKECVDASWESSFRRQLETATPRAFSSRGGTLRVPPRAPPAAQRSCAGLIAIGFADRSTGVDLKCPEVGCSEPSRLQILRRTSNETDARSYESPLDVERSRPILSLHRASRDESRYSLHHQQFLRSKTCHEPAPPVRARGEIRPSANSDSAPVLGCGGEAPARKSKLKSSLLLR